MYGEGNVVFTIISPIRDSNNNYISTLFVIPHNTY